MDAMAIGSIAFVDAAVDEKSRCQPPGCGGACGVLDAHEIQEVAETFGGRCATRAECTAASRGSFSAAKASEGQ